MGEYKGRMPILTHISGHAHFYRLGDDASLHIEKIGLSKGIRVWCW